jgi:hypothetical protein
VVPTGPTLQFTIRQKAQSVGVPLTSWYVNGLQLADAGKLPSSLASASVIGDQNVATEVPPTDDSSVSFSAAAGAPMEPTTDPTLWSGSSSGVSMSGVNLGGASFAGASVGTLHDEALASLSSLENDKKQTKSTGTTWDPSIIDSLFRGF